MVVAELVNFDQPVWDLELEFQQQGLEQEFDLQGPELDFDLQDPGLSFELWDPEPDLWDLVLHLQIDPGHLD